MKTTIRLAEKSKKRKYWGLDAVFYTIDIHIKVLSSLPGFAVEKKCSLYIRGTHKRTKGIYQLSLTLSAEVLKFCQQHMLNSFIQQLLVCDVK